MGKQIFNRNDSAVIKAAMESNDLGEFVRKYEETTTATIKTLTEAYSAIRGNKTQSTIRMCSGTSNNNEPIQPIEPIKTKENMAKKTSSVATAAEEKAPQHRVECENGEPVRIPMEQVEKMEPLEEANAKAVAKANKGTKVASEKKVKEKAPKAEKAAGLTKQDKIKELIISGATNKEIKLLLAEEGLKVYDSEILSAKSKISKSAE
jgi:hypothetical protein